MSLTYAFSKPIHTEYAHLKKTLQLLMALL